MSNGLNDSGDWNFADFSAPIYELMSILERCLQVGDLEEFNTRIERMVLLAPPPLGLLIEIEDQLAQRRRELRQHEFDARERLMALRQSSQPERETDRPDWVVNAEVPAIESLLAHEVEQARDEIEVTEQARALVDMAYIFVSDWRRALSTTAGWQWGQGGPSERKPPAAPPPAQ